jgi:hypothetical protein
VYVTVTAELRGKTVLYTKDIEEKYKNSSKKRRRGGVVPMKAYISALVGEPRWTTHLSAPIPRMTIFRALDILWAVETSMPIDDFKAFVNELMDRSDSALVAPGDMVGIVAAQSCSERFTQTTLNSFHSAGQKKSAVVGIKRIKEILNGTKVVRIPVLGPITTKFDPSRLLSRSLCDLCDESGVVYNPDLLPDEKHSNFLLFFKLTDAKYWERYIHYNKSHFTVSVARDMFFIQDCRTMYVKFTKKTKLGHIKNAYNKVANTHVAGLSKSVDFDYDEDLLMFSPRTSLVKHSKWGMKSVLDLGVIVDECPDVDLTKLYSNDIFYIQATLGITACECFINSELTRVLGNEGININDRHSSLIASNMTSGGSITPNTFGGVDIGDSVILKATFQEATKTFANAAANGLVDGLNDVSAQILFGAKAVLGSAVPHVYPDVGPVVERGIFPSITPPTSPGYGPVSPPVSPMPVLSSPMYIPSSPSYASHEITEPYIQL